MEVVATRSPRQAADGHYAGGLGIVDEKNRDFGDVTDCVGVFGAAVRFLSTLKRDVSDVFMAAKDSCMLTTAAAI